MTPTAEVARKRTRLMNWWGGKSVSTPSLGLGCVQLRRRVRTKDGERIAGRVKVAPRAGQPETGELVRKVRDAGGQDRQIDREQPADLAFDGHDGGRNLRAEGVQSGDQKDARSLLETHYDEADGHGSYRQSPSGRPAAYFAVEEG